MLGKNISWTVLSSFLNITITLFATGYYLQTFTPSAIGSLAFSYLLLSIFIVLSDFGLNGALTRLNILHIKYEAYNLLLILIVTIFAILCWILMCLFLHEIDTYYLLVIYLSSITNIFALEARTTLSIKEKYYVLSIVNIAALFMSHLLTIIILEIWRSIDILFIQKFWYCLFNTIFLFFVTRRISKPIYSNKSLNWNTVKVGGSFNLAQLTDVSYRQSLPAIIGLVSLENAGIFLQGLKLVDMGNDIIGRVYNSIVFSIRVKGSSIGRKIHVYLHLSCVFLILIVFVVFWMIGTDIVSYIFGKQWVDIVPVVQYSLCISLMYVSDMSLRSLVKAYAKPREILGFDIPKKMVLIMSFFLIYVLSMRDLFTAIATIYFVYLVVWAVRSQLRVENSWYLFSVISYLLAEILINLV